MAEEKKKYYQPTHCGNCSNNCHLSSPRCMIGMRYRVNIGWKDEAEEEKKKEKKNA